MTAQSGLRTGLWPAAIFLVGLVVILYAGGAILDRVTVRDPLSKVKWIMARRGATFDFAVLGSSRAQLTTDVTLLDRRWQASGINLGLNGTATPELDLVWDSFLGSSRVSCLLLQVDVNGMDSATFTYPFHDYEYLPFVRDRTVFSHLRSQLGARSYLWRYAPFAGYAEFNDRAMAATRAAVRGGDAGWDSTGSVLLDRSFDSTELSRWTVSRFRIDSARAARLDSIISRARRNGTGVIMYMAPEYIEVDRFQPNRADMLAFYRQKAADHGIPLIDTERSELRNDAANFFDPSHLNRGGAARFTRALAETIESLPVSPCPKTIPRKPIRARETGR